MREPKPARINNFVTFDVKVAIVFFFCKYRLRNFWEKIVLSTND